MQIVCAGDGTTDNIRRGERHRNFIDYDEAYFQITPSDEQKGVRELHEDFKKQGYNHQTTSHQDSFCMSISKHINGIASTIDFKCNREKKDKRLSNHHFPLPLTEKTKHHSGDPRYAALECYSIKFQWFFRMQLIVGGERESTKLFGVLNPDWKGFKRKNLHKN